MVLSKAKIQNLVVYCALTTYGTYSAFELLAQVKKYAGSSNVTIEDVENTISNMENSDFIYKADSIPAPVYVTLQPEKWQEEAKTFFESLKREQNSDKELVIPHGVTSQSPTPPAVIESSKKTDKSKKKSNAKVAPTNSTLTVTTSSKQDTHPASEVTESIKQVPPINKLKQRWYEAHKDEL